MIHRRRITRRGPDRFRLQLPAAERQLLADLLPQLRSLLGEGGGTPGEERTRRMFPTAYPDEPELDAEYQRFMREELVASHITAIERIEQTIGAREIAEGELLAWMQSINALRLVLGTMLDVSEDGARDDPADPGFALYGYLSLLLEEAVNALS